MWADAEHTRTIVGEAFNHTIFLSSVYADSPFRAMLMNTVKSFTAFMACCFCWRCGTRVEGVVRYLGYAAAVVATLGMKKDASFQMGVDDDSWGVTSEHHMARAEVVDKAREDPTVSKAKLNSYTKRFGSHGVSVLVKELDYVDYNNLWIVPFGHAFLYGVVKNFVEAFVVPREAARQCALPLDNRNELSDRGKKGSFMLTSDFNRPHRAIGDHFKNWTMEEFSRAMLVFLPVLCRKVTGKQDVLTPKLLEAFGYLRRFARHHLCIKENRSDEERVEARQQARQDLLNYAKLAEQVRWAWCYISELAPHAKGLAC
jgi:hypothetical protein